MEKDVKFAFKTAELEARWESTCSDVRNRFDLPKARLLCFIDDVNSRWFDDVVGGHARGVYTLAQGSGTLPEYLNAHVISGREFAFDSLIYIPGTTSSADAFLFVATLAEELQHFVQCWSAPKVARVNGLLYRNLAEWDRGRRWDTWDIPAERDAMMASKRVAESVLGVAAVKASVASLIANGPHRKEWEFFRDVSLSAPYDLLAETVRLVCKYRQHLLLLQDRLPGIDFSKTDWWI